MGWLGYTSGGRFVEDCTGTLIAPDVVLTAGHCTFDATSMRFFVTTNADGTTTSHPTATVITFPGFFFHACPEVQDEPDVGLVQLATPIADIEPLRLAAPAPVAVGDVCRIVGFGGHTNDAGQQSSGPKRSATSSVIAVDEKTITVSAGTGIATHGDSGGPLFDGQRIAGVVSCHTDGEVPSHKIEYYTPLSSKAMDWMQSTMTTWATPGSGATSDADASAPRTTP